MCVLLTRCLVTGLGLWLAATGPGFNCISISFLTAWGILASAGTNPGALIIGLSVGASRAGPETWSTGKGAGAVRDGVSTAMGMALMTGAFSGGKLNTVFFTGAAGSAAGSCIAVAGWLVGMLNSRWTALRARSQASTFTMPLNPAWGGMQ